MSRDNGAAAAAGAKGFEFLAEDSSAREQALFKCRVAENAERFDDMVKFIKEVVVGTKVPLEANERNYLSVAYKNSVGTRRAALRCLSAMRMKYEQKGPAAKKNLEHVKRYYTEVLTELQDICIEILKLIDDEVMSSRVLDDLKDDRPTREFKVFFLKMKGDYYRYLSEFAEGDMRKKAIDEAAKNYEEATKMASDGPEDVILPPPHPIRLGLSLNYSVFLYEIQEQPEQAKAHAKQAFDLALDKLDTIGTSGGGSSEQDSSYKDSTLILQLLRDNSTLWSAQDGDNANTTTTGAGGPTAGAQPTEQDTIPATAGADSVQQQHSNDVPDNSNNNNNTSSADQQQQQQSATAQ